jgi:hypothetical protein
MIWINDPKTGKPSVTLSAFIVGFVVCTGKLLLSGIKVTDIITFEQFSGVDYSAALAALGAIYVMRKRDSIKKDGDK